MEKKQETKLCRCKAAIALIAYYEGIKLATLYRWCWLDVASGNYRYRGKAHDYTF